MHLEAWQTTSARTSNAMAALAHGAGRPSMQAGAALGSGVSQQAFKHAAGIRVAGVIPAREAPISKIPIGGAGFGNQLRNSYFLVGRPVRIKRGQVHRPLKLRHCRYKPNFRRSIAGTL